ncbi:helix-turn-helix domain-containing protein [Flavobacterium sp. J49]|uniref:helix-turn-helix domain-containing protein n=1 Tax=Flavobacterium sp. J49 TaxID=2718534 RepID=UPI0015937986|nr:helix-turn-helix domain-containing protein [Flavobacterium sp. J49]NIC03226.1 helix-turn-helix domain-containing protein [Flavobacterium sp. J49]
MSSKEFQILLKAILDLRALLEVSKPVVEEDFLDSHAMEKLLRCSPAKLYRLRKNGSVPCVLVGRSYLYPKHFFTQEVLNSITKPDDPSKRFDDKTN